MTVLDARYPVPCRQILSYSLSPTAVEIHIEKLQHELQKCSSVALTTDVCIYRIMHSFLGTTVHTFVGCVRASHLLAFMALHGIHTAQRIADDLNNSVMREYFLKVKVRFVVTDNVSNMIKALCLFFPSDSDHDTTNSDTEVIIQPPVKKARTSLCDHYYMPGTCS
jgi:hypothetical protein